MDPKQKTIQRKRESVDSSQNGKKKAASEHDWILQELAEGKPVPRTGDNIDDAVGRKIYVARDSRAEWKSPSDGHRLTVARHYWHEPGIIIDKPYTPAEMEDKAKFFKTTGITYVAIAPGESLSSEDLRTRIREALIETAKRLRPPQAAKPAPAKLPKAKVIDPPLRAPARPAAKKKVGR